MRILLVAILRRCIAFAVVFAISVSAVMLRVYYLHDDDLGSDPLDVSNVREEILLRWRTPYSFKVFLPPKDELTDDRLSRYPHPFTLVVSVDEQRRLFLNHAPFGTLADTSFLKDRLRRLFAEREQAGAYSVARDLHTWSVQQRPTVEKTVRVEVPHAFLYGEVVGLIDAIKVAGAEPIELQIDGPINFEKGTDRIPDAISHR